MMKNDNLSFLHENLRYLGFGEALPLNDELDQKVKNGDKEFMLTTEVHFDEWSRIEAVLFFRKSDKEEMYFFNKYVAFLSYHEKPENNKQQTFYISKGAGVTLKEAYNLLQGRAVNKNLTNIEGEKYNAWIQLDFGTRTSNNNYKVRQFTTQYGYDLEKVLHNYPIRELEDDELKANLIRSLKKGNIHPVTFAKTNKIEKMYIEACPQFKTIHIFSLPERPSERPKPQRDLHRKGSIAFSPGNLEIPPGGKENDGENEMEEEKELPVEIPVHIDGLSARKRSRRSA